MGSSLRRSHRAWLLKVVGVLASCLAAGLVTASVVSGTNAIASLSTDTTTSDTTSAAPTAPSIRAEKDDYVPSEVVTLWATGWAPGEVVEVFVNDDEGRTWNHTGTATADELGAFMYEFALPDWFVATYQVTATGDSGSVATSSFADSVAVGTSNATSNGSAGLASQQITISAPAVSVGDVLIAQIVITDSITNTFICPNNPPGGWTTVLKNNRDDKILQETFWFRAAVAAPATSYTWQFKTTSCAGSLIGAGTKGASGGITRFAGVVATGNPYDVAVGANSSSSGPFTAPAATTTVADTRILRFFGVFKNTNITDPPAAPVVPRLYHVASSAAKERAAAAFDTGQQLAIGSTGPYTANVASGSEAAFQTVALTSAVLVASDAPVVSSPICAGATSVSGTSSEAVGTTIEVFKNGASVGTTTVLAGGSWTKGSLAALVAGDQITARATAVGETVSPDSAIVTVSACNAAPTTPADLAQFRTDATTPIALGGFTNETSAVLEGNLADPDANDMVKLEVEVKPVGTAFDTTGLVSGAFVTDPSTASVTVSGLSHGVAYHWRGRAVDDDGAASAWQSFGGGNPESAADFTVDTAKPTLTASATSPPAGPAYVAGTWTNQNVRVAFDCQDPVSGVAVDTVLDVTVSTDGADQSVTSAGSCTDVAGNTADAATFSNIDLDKTAPVDVETLLERSPDHNGWYNEPLGWETTGDDDTSGIASCSSGTYSGPDATGLSVSGFCTDLAGNSSAAVSSVLFDYDATAPVDVQTLLGRGPDHNGWYNAPLDWETSGTDDTSGIASCDSGTYSTPDSTGLTVSGACTDIAGNSSAAVSSVLFDYDATAPVDVETLLERAPDHNGWYNAPLDWETSGSDDTSGIDTCSSGTYSALDGTALTVSGSCTDAAGNSSDPVASDEFDYDATAPVDVETLLGRAPDHNGWYNAPLDWETTGTDDTSGIDSCDSGTHSTPDATGLTVSGACTDNAGNSSAAVASDEFDYDATAPVDVETLLGRGPDHNGWYNAPLDWETSGTDDTSGIDSCDSGTHSAPDGTGLTVSGSCTDAAGNSSAAVSSVLFDYDATAPVDVETLLGRAPDHNGWYNAPLDWETSGTDDTSGIDSCDSGTYSTPDATGLTVSGACTDNAGNSSAAVASDEFDYDATAPVDVETLLGRGPDHNGWYNAPLDWETSGTDDTSGIDSCDSGTYSTPDATGLTVSGACTDNAGNSSAAVASDEFDYDATAPVDVETLLGRGPDHNGWYNAPLDWETTGDDLTSGIDTCSSGTYSTPDDTAVTVSGFCTDNAGNSSAAIASDEFDYDATAPVDVETLLGRGPDHNGWYNAPLDWETSGTDDTSGIDSCDSGTYSTPDATGLTVSGACTDNAGNSSAAVASLAFDYDATDPVDVQTLLERGPDHGGWYNAPLDWETTGNDFTSGIDTCSSGTYSTPDDTAVTVSGFCTDNAGNSSDPVASEEFDYDNTDPQLSPVVTPNPVVLNGSATASPNATDNLSGVDSSSCDPVDTSAVGAHSVSCSATDNAGNSGTANAWYSVVFNFQGFFQPVDNGGVYNVVQAGRAIPVKFSLGGNQGLNILTSGYPVSTKVECSGAAGTDVLEETMTSGSSGLQYDGTVNPPVGQYVYVWKTEKSWASTCRRLDVKLADGQTRSAFFSFKK